MAAAAGSGLLTGRITDESGKPIRGANIRLGNRISGHRQAVQSNASGRFSLYNIPYNSYRLEVAAPGFQEAHWDVDVRGNLPIELNLILPMVGTAVVEVEEKSNLLEAHFSAHIDIDRTTIEQIPSVVSSRGMENILLATPGFIQDENGRFHFRGSHGQVMYVIDGIPVTDQVQATFSNSLDPGQVDAMEVITGGVSAEYGGKPVAVVNLTSKSGLGTPDGFAGMASAGLARFRTFETGFEARGSTDRSGYFVTVAGSQSDRFLDPVNFENFHNHGTTGRIFTRFDWLPTDSDTLRLSLSGGRTRRDVVNLASQQANGQNQQVENVDGNASLGWSHLFSTTRSLDAALFFRHSTSTLNPTQDLSPGYQDGGPDYPVWASQDRSLDNQGLIFAYNQKDGENAFKAGLQFVRYPIHEHFRFAITDSNSPLIWDNQGNPDPTNPLYAYTPAGGGRIFTFDDRITPTLASVYIQDDLKAGNWNLGMGLRLDSYHGRNFVQNELQPRLGIAYTIPSSKTLFRVVYDRLLVTPENEGLAFSTSQFVWTTTTGLNSPVAQLRSEIQDSYLVGVEQQLGSVARVSLDYWWKSASNASDNSQFSNTGLLFPIAASKGKFHGLDVRLETIPLMGWSGYLSAGTVRTVFYNPTVGGLGAASATGDTSAYLIDHDQKLTMQIGLGYQHDGFHAQVVGRYDSGLEAGDSNDPLLQRYQSDYAFGLPYIRSEVDSLIGPNNRIRSRTVWNLSLGQEVKLAGKKSIEVDTNLLNAFDEKGLYNFLSTFGGTHVIPPRTLAVNIKFKF